MMCEQTFGLIESLPREIRVAEYQKFIDEDRRLAERQ